MAFWCDPQEAIPFSDPSLPVQRHPAHSDCKTFRNHRWFCCLSAQQQEQWGLGFVQNREHPCSNSGWRIPIAQVNLQHLNLQPGLCPPCSQRRESNTLTTFTLARLDTLSSGDTVFRHQLLNMYATSWAGLPSLP